MREEEKALSRTAIAGLWLIAIVVELVLTYTLLWLNGLQAIFRGYWTFFWIFFAVWAILSIAWITAMSTFISRKKRRKTIKHLRGR